MHPGASCLSRFPKDSHGDFPGDPLVKTSPSNAGDACLIPVQVTKIPYALRPKKSKHKTEAVL